MNHTCDIDYSVRSRTAVLGQHKLTTVYIVSKNTGAVTVSLYLVINGTEGLRVDSK